MEKYEMKEKIIVEFRKVDKLRSTKGQLDIIEEICNNPDFGDVPGLWKIIHKKNGVSIATVYRTIGILVNLGFVRKEKQKMGYHYYLNAH